MPIAQLFPLLSNLSRVDKLRVIEFLVSELAKEEDLANLESKEVEGTDEVIPANEIAESEAALADYLAGRDLGKSLKQVELELFGRELD